MIDCLEGKLKNFSCVCNTGYIYPLNFAFEKNQTCSQSVDVLTFEYIFYIIINLLFLIGGGICFFKNLNIQKQSTIQNKKYFVILLSRLSLVFLIINILFWIIDSIIILSYLTRSISLSRYIFWSATTCFILMLDFSSSTLKELLRLLHNQKITTFYMFLWYTPTPLMGTLFLFLGLATSWLDNFPTLFHLSVASLWCIFASIYHIIVSLQFIYNLENITNLVIHFNNDTLVLNKIKNTKNILLRNLIATLFDIVLSCLTIILVIFYPVYAQIVFQINIISSNGHSLLLLWFLKV